MSSANSSPPSEAPTPASSAAPETTPADGAPADAQFEAALKDLDAARAEVSDLKDKFLRARADTENVRRRAELDVAAAHKFALDRFAVEIINVRDSLELARTVELSGDPDVVQKMHEGLELTLKLLDSVFQKFGITLLDPKGEKFDPARHQAISTLESAETPPNHVVNVVQKGYLLHDRLLRPAMVIVARQKSGDQPEENAENRGPPA